MPPLTSFRQAVQDALADAYGVPFVAGDLTGPSTERDAGCVWTRGKREADPVLDEEILLGVRVFAQWKQPEGDTSRPNEEELETALETLQTALNPLQTTLGPWMLRVTELEIVREQSAVEATIVARQLNLGTA